MKKLFMLLLAVLLLLSFAGCGAMTPAETEPETTVQTDAPTAAPETQASAEAPTEPGKVYEKTVVKDIFIEGEPQKMTMELFDGGNYVVYLPQDEWILETDLVDGYLTDHWVCSFNDMIEFEVISFGPLPKQEAEQYIQQKKSSYTWDPSAPEFVGGMDPVRHYFLDVEIFSDERNTFGLAAEYPMEAGDGFAPRFREIFNSFEIP